MSVDPPLTTDFAQIHVIVMLSDGNDDRFPLIRRLQLLRSYVLAGIQREQVRFGSTMAGRKVNLMSFIRVLQKSECAESKLSH
jgi:hypothetical protein